MAYRNTLSLLEWIFSVDLLLLCTEVFKFCVVSFVYFEFFVCAFSVI
jgi:hypothetical protein